MNRKKIRASWIILTISLCFNIFFTWGYISSRNTKNKIKSPEGRTELIAKRLDLSEDQKEAFIELRKHLKSQAIEIKQNYRDEMNAFWCEVVKDEPDSLIIKQSIERAAHGHKEFMMITSQQIQDFLQILNPKQQQAYIRFLRRNKLNI